jgi:hypothetical protein
MQAYYILVNVIYFIPSPSPISFSKKPFFENMHHFHFQKTAFLKMKVSYAFDNLSIDTIMSRLPRPRFEILGRLHDSATALPPV